MGLRHAVLASLLEGDAAGYELSKRFDVSVANFWSATPQQLYRDHQLAQPCGITGDPRQLQANKGNSVAARSVVRPRQHVVRRPGSARHHALISIHGPPTTPIE